MKIGQTTNQFIVVESVIVVSAGIAVVSTATAVVSVVDSVVELPPPQDANASAKPHTIASAITFFIVYRF